MVRFCLPPLRRSTLLFCSVFQSFRFKADPKTILAFFLYFLRVVIVVDLGGQKACLIIKRENIGEIEGCQNVFELKVFVFLLLSLSRHVLLYFSVLGRQVACILIIADIKK